MDGTLYTLEEAAKLTGLSPEALRKRFMRGQIEGIPSKASNDGKVRIRLTDGQLSDLRRVDGQVDEEPPETAVRVDGDLTVHPAVQALSRLADSLEHRAVRAEAQADRAMDALAAERAGRDSERAQWLAELEETRAGRQRDRRAAMAAIERLKRGNAALQAKMDEIREGQGAQQVAPQAEIDASSAPKPKGILARLFHRGIA
jgi:hypothetical protein